VKLKLVLDRRELILLSNFCRDALENYYSTWKNEFINPEKAVPKEVYEAILTELYSQALKQDKDLQESFKMIKEWMGAFPEAKP
jgi:hypothetical protein